MTGQEGMQSSWPREEACRRPGKGTGVGGVTWKGDVFASPCPTCSAFSRSYPSFPSCPPHTSPIVTHATEHPGLTHCPQHAPHPVLQGMCPRNLAHLEPQLPPPANVHHCAAATGGSSGLKGKDGAEKRFSGLRIPMTGALACPPNGPQALGLGHRPHSLAGWLTDSQAGNPWRALHHSPPHSSLGPPQEPPVQHGRKSQHLLPAKVEPDSWQDRKLGRTPQDLLLVEPQGASIPPVMTPRLSSSLLGACSSPLGEPGQLD